MTTHQANVELWERTHDPNAMLQANMGLIYLLANKHAVKLNRGRLIEDYVQAACVGFLEQFSMHDWDPEQGVIGTFVHWRVLSSMQELVDRSAWYGVQAKSEHVQGNRQIPDWFNGGVRSLDAVVIHGPNGHELGEVLPDPAWEHGYVGVEREIDFGILMGELRATLDSHTDRHVEGQWLEDYLVAASESELTLHPRLGALWGVSRQAVIDRLSRVQDVLRESHPTLVVGEARHYRIRASL